ncbi:MAG: hypothetical protein ABW189_00885 [Rickettsiales bacterium]
MRTHASFPSALALMTQAPGSLKIVVHFAKNMTIINDLVAWFLIIGYALAHLPSLFHAAAPSRPSRKFSAASFMNAAFSVLRVTLEICLWLFRLCAVQCLFWSFVAFFVARHYGIRAYSKCMEYAVVTILVSYYAYMEECCRHNPEGDAPHGELAKQISALESQVRKYGSSANKYQSPHGDSSRADNDTEENLADRIANFRRKVEKYSSSSKTPEAIAQNLLKAFRTYIQSIASFAPEEYVCCLESMATQLGNAIEESRIAKNIIQPYAIASITNGFFTASDNTCDCVITEDQRTLLATADQEFTTTVENLGAEHEQEVLIFTTSVEDATKRVFQIDNVTRFP